MMQYQYDTGILFCKFMLQLQLMLFVDCTMTNIQNSSLAKIVDFVPKLKFGGSGNLLDVLMKGTNYCDDGFIAGIPTRCDT
jgi:hypothetical protein